MPLDASIFASGLPQLNAALPFQGASVPPGAGGIPANIPAPTLGGSVPVPPSLAPIYARESGGNFQAQNPTSTASGAGQDINATWREAMQALGYGDTYPTAKSAPPAIQNAANIWLQGRYGNKPWAASEPGAAGGGDFAKLAQETESIYGPLSEKYKAASAEALKTLSNIDPNDPDLDKRIGEALDKTNALTDEVLQKMQKPPTPPSPLQGMKALGSPAAILGILAGFMGRRHAIDSFSAAAAAIGASNQGDWQRYAVAQNVWKDQMQTLIQVSQLQQQGLRNILEDRNMAMNEKLAVAGAKMRAMGLSLQGDVLEAQGADAALKMSMQISAQNARMQEMLDLVGLRAQASAGTHGWQIQQTPNGQLLRVNPNTGEVQNLSLPQGTTKQTSQPPLPPPLQFPDKWPGMPNSPPPGVRPDIWAMAINWARSGQRPPISLWSNNEQSLQFMQAIPAAQHALGITPTSESDIQASFAGERHGAIVTAGRSAQLGMAINEARAFLPMAVDASNKVDRTQYPTLNSIIEAYDKGTGDENVVRFAVATNALSNAYAQVATRGGQSTDAARAQAREILDIAFAKGQFATAADQMMKEVQAAQAAPPAAWREMQRTFAGQFGAAPAGASDFTQPPGGGPAPPAVGEIRDGYKFLGGDPADQNNWQKQ